MTYLTLCYIFFKVGLFTIGGGLATLGLLNDYLVRPGFISEDLFYNMVAISQSTPGPIGVNLATYVGYTYYGVPGALVATFSLALPAFVIITIIAFVLHGFKDNKYVVAAFGGFRPAAVGIILSVTYMIIVNSVLDVDAGFEFGWDLCVRGLLCILTVVLILRFEVHPILCIVLGGVVGGLLL